MCMSLAEVRCVLNCPCAKHALSVLSHFMCSSGVLAAAGRDVLWLLQLPMLSVIV
jgi:hypothetical protein